MHMFNKGETISFLVDLLKTNSPTGYTKKAIHFLKNEIETLGYKTKTIPKGNLIVQVKGQNTRQTRGLSAHIDILGLMVRSINSDGTLSLTTLGGPLTPTLDREYCEIITRDEKNLYRNDLIKIVFYSCL